MAEINIRELSIGDWISDKNGIAAQVRGFECWSDGYVVNVRTKAGAIANLREAGVCPIPLLPKILEKNGFVRGEYSEIRVYNEWEIGEWSDPPYASVRLDIDRQVIRVTNRGRDMFIAEKEVYVHQLQHALRLAGVEKEIEV